VASVYHLPWSHGETHFSMLVHVCCWLPHHRFGTSKWPIKCGRDHDFQNDFIEILSTRLKETVAREPNVLYVTFVWACGHVVLVCLCVHMRVCPRARACV
jgi:hypothetical protein